MVKKIMMLSIVSGIVAGTLSADNNVEPNNKANRKAEFEKKVAFYDAHPNKIGIKNQNTTVNADDKFSKKSRISGNHSKFIVKANEFSQINNNKDTRLALMHLKDGDNLNNGLSSDNRLKMRDDANNFSNGLLPLMDKRTPEKSTSKILSKLDAKTITTTTETLEKNITSSAEDIADAELKLSEEEKNVESKLKEIFKKQTEYTFDDQKAVVDILNSLKNKGHNLYAIYYNDICDILGIDNDKTRAKYSYNLPKYSAYIETMSKAMNATAGNDKKLYAPFIRTKGTIHEQALKRASRTQLASTITELKTTIEELNSTNEALRKQIADLLNGKTNNDTNQLKAMEMLYQIIELSGKEGQELSLPNMGKAISEIADNAITVQDQQMKIIEEKYGNHSVTLKEICDKLKLSFEKTRDLLSSSEAYSVQDIEKTLQTTNETLINIRDLISSAMLEVNKLNETSVSSEDKKIQKSDINTKVNFSTIFYDAFAKSISAFNEMEKRLKQQTVANEEIATLNAKLLKLQAAKKRMEKMLAGKKSQKSSTPLNKV